MYGLLWTTFRLPRRSALMFSDICLLRLGGRSDFMCDRFTHYSATHGYVAIELIINTSRNFSSG